MQNPVPDNQELNAAYSVSSGYSCYRAAWQETGWPVWKFLRIWTTRRRVSRVQRYGEGHKLLEVGCGAGDFLVASHRAGWEVSAVEYNAEMVDAVRRSFGFDVRLGELAPGLWTEGQFDVVVMWNVLEHVQNPVRDLTIAASYLRPGGRIFLNAPSRQAAERGQWFGQYWALLDLPRHIHFLDRTALVRLCDKAGLELSFYQTPLVQSAWCYYMSCWNLASRKGGKVLRWPWFLALAAAVTLGLPYIAVRSRAGLGMESFAVIVKKGQNSAD